MLSEEMAKASADLFAKFSANAQAQQKEIQQRIRVLSLESLGLVRDELERLRVEEGRDFANAAAAAGLVRQHLESADLGNAVAIAEIEQVKLASNWSEALQHFRPEVDDKRTRIQQQMRALIIEDLDISLEEFRRLGVESTGREALDYQQVAAVLGLMQQQLETQDFEDTEIAGPLGLVVDFARTAARADIQARAQGN